MAVTAPAFFLTPAPDGGPSAAVPAFFSFLASSVRTHVGRPSGCCMSVTCSTEYRSTGAAVLSKALYKIVLDMRIYGPFAVGVGGGQGLCDSYPT